MKQRRYLRNIPDSVWLEAYQRPARETAERFGMSIAAVHRRWNRLRKRGLITGPAPRQCRAGVVRWRWPSKLKREFNQAFE
jgi:transposase